VPHVTDRTIPLHTLAGINDIQSTVEAGIAIKMTVDIDTQWAYGTVCINSLQQIATISHHEVL
jgi:hypothetical protein